MTSSLRMSAPRLPRGSVSCGPSCSGRVVGPPPAAGLLARGRACSSARSLGSNASSSAADAKAATEHARVQAFLERLLRGQADQPFPLHFASAQAGAERNEHVDCGGGTFYVTVDEKPAPSQDNANGPDPEDPERKAKDYYANLGYAIRTLREDIPILFVKDLNYDIYREDVVFKDPRNTFKGMDKYKTIFWSLRFHGRIFFRSIYVEIKRLWQIDDNCIRMRWTVHGFPRVPWEAEGTFDGVSEFKLDRDGKIYSHSVDNVIFRDPPGEKMPLFARLSLNPYGETVPTGGWCTCEEGEEVRDIFAQSLMLRLYLASALSLPKSHPADVEMESSV